MFELLLSLTICSYSCDEGQVLFCIVRRDGSEFCECKYVYTTQVLDDQESA